MDNPKRALSKSGNTLGTNIKIQQSMTLMSIFPGVLAIIKSIPNKAMDKIEYSGRFWTVIPETQYRDSALMDTAILGIEYRDSGQRIPIFFIMYPYALKRKYITKEVIVYNQVSRDHPAIRIRS